MAENNLDTFSSLLEQALRNPEPGAVNFNILRRLLSALLQCLNLSDLSVSNLSSLDIQTTFQGLQRRLSDLEEIVGGVSATSNNSADLCNALDRVINMESDFHHVSAAVNDLSAHLSALQDEQANYTAIFKDVESFQNASVHLLKVEEELNAFSKILGPHDESACVFEGLEKCEKSINNLGQRVENLEKSPVALQSSDSLVTDTRNNYIELLKRVDAMSERLDQDIKSANGQEISGNKEIRISVESLKMAIGDVSEAMDKLRHVVKDIKEDVSNVVQEKVSKSELEAALNESITKHNKESATEWNELYQTVNLLKLEVADIAQNLRDFELSIKCTLSRLIAQINDKADEKEVASSQSRVLSELHQLRKNLGVYASNELTPNLTAKGLLRDEAAGLRKKMVLHCISCDRPLTIEEKGRADSRGNYIDPPYIRTKNGVYDAYRVRRGIGGSHTTLRSVEPLRTEYRTSKASTIPPDCSGEEGKETRISPDLKEDFETPEPNEIALERDTSCSGLTHTLAPQSSPRLQEADIQSLSTEQ